MISVTSSTIPGNNKFMIDIINFNRCDANPQVRKAKTLLNALPIVNPYPGSKGLNSNLPSKSVESIIITLSGLKCEYLP